MDVVGADLLERAGPAHQVYVVSPDVHQEHRYLPVAKVANELQQGFTTAM